VAFRNVQRVEVIEISFNFTIVFDDVAERDEDVFDSLPHQRDRMQMSRPRAPAGNGDIDRFARGAGCIDYRFQFLFRRLERLGNLCFRALNELTKAGPLFRGHTPDQFFTRRNRALLSRMTRAQIGDHALLSFSFLQRQRRVVASKVCEAFKLARKG
jgi:hypothetical protein